MNLSLEAMDTTADGLKLGMIMRGYRTTALLLQFLDTRLDRRLVDAHYLMMRVHLDIQGLANRHDQMLFVELGISLHGFVLDVFGDLTQLSESFVLKFVMCVGH